MFALSFCCSFPMNERPKAIDFSPVAVIVAMIVISMGMSLGIRMSHLIICKCTTSTQIPHAYTSQSPI